MLNRSFAFITYSCLILCVIIFIELFSLSSLPKSDMTWVSLSLISWSVLLLESLIFYNKFPSPCLQFSLLSTIMIICVSSANRLLDVNILAVCILLLLFVNYILFSLKSLTLTEAALSFIRMYIVFDFLAHCSEKLFSGPTSYHELLQAFITLNLPAPHLLMPLAGLCEFGAVIALGLGFLTRLGAFCTALYLLIATIAGHHFSLGFMWIAQGGGWEHPMMWIMLTLTFAFTSGGKFSLDYLIVTDLKPGKLYNLLSAQPSYVA